MSRFLILIRLIIKTTENCFCQSKIYKAVTYNYKFLTFRKDINIILKEKSNPVKRCFFLLPGYYLQCIIVPKTYKLSLRQRSVWFVKASGIH